jgi:23S rRNA (uracil1939-C5)-methyltransferase
METIELEIEALAAGGDGVGRAADGRVVFAPFTAPGDRLRLRVTETHARFLRGEIEMLLSPGPARIAPVCGVYGQCGGCTWQHVDYAAQLEAKREILRDALERLGGIALAGPPEVVACPSPYRYRSRARVVVVDGRVGYRRRRSHALCATSRCPVLVPELEAELARLAALAPRGGPPEWELVAGAEGATRATPLGHPLPLEPSLALEVGGDRLAFSPGVFVQGNARMLDALASAVHQAAGRGRLGAELFAGAGFFTVGLARRFERLIAVESERRSVADLRRNLAQAGLANVEVRGGRAERVLDALAGAEVVVVDPPRTGLPPGMTDALARLAPARLVYVSCDPATLARDVRALAAGGFGLASVRGLDLFPQTPHLEAVAVLERGARRS